MLQGGEIVFCLDLSYAFVVDLDIFYSAFVWP
jgi:hypothetical protein